MYNTESVALIPSGFDSHSTDGGGLDVSLSNKPRALGQRRTSGELQTAEVSFLRVGAADGIVVRE